jgi:hypothetical protein
MIERATFRPRAWTLNKAGMQGGAVIEDAVDLDAAWEVARTNAIATARDMARLGEHKQHVNRVIEPFLWTDVLVSSVEWDNFFRQRLEPGAQPEMRELAERMHRLSLGRVRSCGALTCRM